MGTGMLDAVRGAYATPSQTSTLVGALNLGVTARVVVSRVFPLIAAAGVALWVRSRVGDRTASPQPLDRVGARRIEHQGRHRGRRW